MFRAYDPEHERLVAIKLFKLDLPPERVHQLVAAFQRLIAADLTHPVLAAPLSTGITDVTAYLVQDFVSAESLDLVVREYGPAPPADALRVAAQLARALDSAAAVNIFHGALHPRDVLLSSDDTRLTGVGVARALEQAGVTAPVRRPYTAPERMAGATWDRRADVFSLAALVHELLWARRVGGLGADAAESLAPLEGADPAAMRAAFARALAENPEERFTTALEFAEALAYAFPDLTVSSGRPAARPSASQGSPTDLEPRLPLDLASAFAPAIPPGPDPELSMAHAAPEPLLDVDEGFNRPAERFQDVTPTVLMPPAPPSNRRRAPQREHGAADVEPLLVDVPALDDARGDGELLAETNHQAIAAPAGFITGHDPESALDRSRSAVWPLALALTVGLAIGFAAGYGVGHDRASQDAAAAAVPAGREFTESAVTEPSRTVSPAVATPPAPTKEAATPQPAAAESGALPGRLLVRSMPSGASVSVDGREYGKAPATVRNLARGPHSVRVTRDGYLAQERRVVISPSRPAQSVNVSLVRAPAQPRPAAPVASAPSGAAAPARFAGALAVDSLPPGAKVYLDGKLIGSTPLSLPTVAAGEHAVRLERDGYRHWSSSVRVVASEQNRVTASLER